MDWTKTNDMKRPDVKKEVAVSISHKKIPYPLPENLRLIHTAYEAQFPAEKTCKHGNVYSSEDPDGFFLMMW